MHTVVVVAVGFVLLGLFLLGGRLLNGGGGMAVAALVFLPVWLVGAATNTYFGVKKGYSVASEVPFFLLIFLMPAMIALVVWWRAR